MHAEHLEAVRRLGPPYDQRASENQEADDIDPSQFDNIDDDIFARKIVACIG